MNYVIMTREEAGLKKGESALTGDDIAELVSIKEILYRFLDKSKISYQLSLGMGKHKGNEAIVYAKIEAFDEIKKSLEATEKSLIEYHKSIQQKSK